MEIVLYRTEDDNVTVSALIKDETIWITQKAMAELFGIDKSGISRHLAKIFKTGELDEEVVVAKIATITQHGAMQGKTQTIPTNYYNLDAIISVGYRVNSIQATKFRIWATGILKEYMIKGFAMDDERLKQGKTAFGKDYFRELLERVRSIRASERGIWQQITDISDGRCPRLYRRWVTNLYQWRVLHHRYFFIVLYFSPCYFETAHEK